MAAAALAPVPSLRFNSTLRFLSSYPRTTLPQAQSQPPIFPPILPRPSPLSGATRRRSFCTVISGALHSGSGAAERTKPEIAESWRAESGNNRVGEFRKKLKVVDIKGGLDEGLERVGQSLVVTGWVRTFRVQSSVTFIEVNDGSCLSNMQCVLGSEAEGYDQVESGSVTTGASIWVQGILAASQGSKQKVELKVKKIVLVLSLLVESHMGTISS